MHRSACGSLENNYLRLCPDFSAIIAKIFLRVSFCLLILDLGNCHEILLLAEFVFFEDGFDLG